MNSNRGGRLVWWVVVMLAAATVAAAAVGSWQMVVKNRPLPAVADQPAARQAATQAATNATVKVLTYSYETLDQDINAASALLTGDFLSYYQQFANQIVRPSAQQKQIKTSATVLRSGVETLTTAKARILVFVDQSTTSLDQPSPKLTPSSVRVGMDKVNGNWLLASFDPV